MFSWSKKPGSEQPSAGKLSLDAKMQAAVANVTPPEAPTTGFMNMKPAATSTPASAQPSPATATPPINGHGATPAMAAAPNGDKGTPFKHAAPEGHGKKVSEVLGEIVWLMSQSPVHKQFFIADLEWFVMTPILLQQFRLFYAKDRPSCRRHASSMMGVVLWGLVNDETAARLAAGASKIRPQDWKSGDQVWAVEVIAPFGGAEDMIKDLKAQVFPAKAVRYMAVTGDGRKELRVLS